MHYFLNISSTATMLHTACVDTFFAPSSISFSSFPTYAALRTEIRFYSNKITRR